MARLTKAQIKAYRAELERWQRPEDLLNRSEELMIGISREDFFNQPGLDFIREGWAAAKFGIARAAREVRVVPAIETWPDFEMRTNDSVELWELTEADVPGRRRGQEYRDDPLMPGDRALGLDHTENYIARAEKIPEALYTRCVAKAEKRYSARSGLLIYLNISDFGTRHQETINKFASATAPAKDVFNEVWILWKGRAYAVWKGGELAS